MFVDKINVPNILSEEQVLIEYENEKEIKSLFDKIKKKNHYYIIYSYEDSEKNIDALNIRNIVNFFYKKTIFYFIEKDKENNFLIFSGNTVFLDENTFKTAKFNYKNIDNLKKMALLDETVLGIKNKIVFFINVSEKEKEEILQLLNAKEGNLNKIIFFTFPGFNFISRYKIEIFAVILIFIMFGGINYILKQEQKEIWRKQENIVREYQDKSNLINKRINSIQKQMRFFYVPKNIKIFEGN